ncbi:alpha-amylase-related protein-like [Condylostylus longicornis]|uniref:alpha-amylase-related protein-like n=1 Tax=Condylostylus longicornis TaxID=2530218 RepID=UPI00244E2A79|nr:alpha-amylase-related protein-like [Condylostylus longicornis]
MLLLKNQILIIASICIYKSFGQSSSGDGRGDQYKNPHFHPNHIGIVQMFQWPFDYIARECEEYLGPQGFGGVQVSPIFENSILDGRPWYELYQPISYKIKTRLGDEAQFRNMIKRCNKAGVRIYVDVILNHMARSGKGILHGTAGSIACPELSFYPAVPYTLLDFHLPCKINDWNDKKQMRKCRLFNLPDLNQAKPNVRNKLVQMLNNLISMGVAGFRVDASSFMDPIDLQHIFSKLNDLSTQHNFPESSKPFIYHEAHHWKSEYTHLGRVIEFNFEEIISRVMRNQINLNNADNFVRNYNLVESYNAVVDLDNHDAQRTFNYLNYKDPVPYKMGLGFLLGFSYGIPKLISSFDFKSFDESPPSDIKQNIIDPRPRKDGTCQVNWNCEHRYYSVREMLRFARIVEGEPVRNFFSNDYGQFGFCRGDKGFIAFNPSSRDMEIEMDVCVPPGTYCDIISGSYEAEIYKEFKGDTSDECSGNKIIVDENRKAVIKIPGNDSKKFIAFYQKP